MVSGYTPFSQSVCAPRKKEERKKKKEEEEEEEEGEECRQERKSMSARAKNQVRKNKKKKEAKQEQEKEEKPGQRAGSEGAHCRHGALLKGPTRGRHATQAGQIVFHFFCGALSARPSFLSPLGPRREASMILLHAEGHPALLPSPSPHQTKKDKRKKENKKMWETYAFFARDGCVQCSRHIVAC